MLLILEINHRLYMNHQRTLHSHGLLLVAPPDSHLSLPATNSNPFDQRSTVPVPNPRRSLKLNSEHSSSGKESVDGGPFDIICKIGQELPSAMHQYTEMYTQAIAACSSVDRSSNQSNPVQVVPAFMAQEASNNIYPTSQPWYRTEDESNQVVYFV